MVSAVDRSLVAQVFLSDFYFGQLAKKLTVAIITIKL